MKKILLFAAGLLALTCVSCSRKATFTEIPFVFFPTPSLSVYEDAGDIEIPVRAYADVAFTLTFETVDGEKYDNSTGVMVPNGQKGVDYDIVDNEAAIVRFEAADTLKKIKVHISDFPGVLTGNKDFTIKITGSGNEVTTGGYSYCKVTIIDNDHPLKAIFGEYMATDGDGVTWTMTLTDDPDNWYVTFIDGIVPTFAGNYVGQGLRHYVPANVSENLSRISVPLGYKLADKYLEEDITIWGYDGTYIYPSGSLVFEKTEDGYKLDGDKGFAALYESGGYYYLAASNSLTVAPITLVKK
ncbi:MAG: hypothetical protein IK031_04175 [Bacteroidales bacterium]|nr:hypothetical protein [Bacteroidales bacterium]